MNNSADGDDAVLAASLAVNQPPLSLLVGGKAVDALPGELAELALANEQLLRAVGDVRDVEHVIAAGTRQLRAATQRIKVLEGTISTLQQELNEYKDTARTHEAELNRLSRARDSAVAEALRLRLELEQVRSAKSDAIRNVQELTGALELASGRVAWAEKGAERQRVQVQALQADLAQSLQATDTLESALDAVIAERDGVLMEVQQACLETGEWVRECERLIIQGEEQRAAAEAIREQHNSALSLLDERNNELLEWLDTAERLNDQVQTLESSLEQEHENARHWHGRCEALEEHLEEVREERRHWHGRSEALDVHLENARAEGAQRASELQWQLDLEKAAKEKLERDVAELVDRVTKITHAEIERTRGEIAHLSTAVNNVQSGRVWAVKYWLRRIIRRG